VLKWNGEHVNNSENVIVNKYFLEAVLRNATLVCSSCYYWLHFTISLHHDTCSKHMPALRPGSCTGPMCCPRGWTCVMLSYTDWSSYRQPWTSTAVHDHPRTDPPGANVCCADSGLKMKSRPCCLAGSHRDCRVGLIGLILSHSGWQHRNRERCFTFSPV